MNLEEFNRTARILGHRYVPSILRELDRKGWTKASDIASYLDISTATAVDYLKKLEDINILERRRVKSETGHAWEYRLNSRHISIETEIEG